MVSRGIKRLIEVRRLAGFCHSVRAGSANPPAPVATLTGVVPAHLLDEGEAVILAIKPSLWFILFASAKVFLVVAAVVFLAWRWEYVYRDLFSFLSFRTIYQIAAVVVAVQLAVSFVVWLSRLYVLTNRRVIRIKGVFNIDIFEAPLARIQNTYLTLAVYERPVGLGSIHFATAGTAAIEATWQNISQPLDVHEMIRRAMRNARGPSSENGL